MKDNLSDKLTAHLGPDPWYDVMDRITVGRRVPLGDYQGLDISFHKTVRVADVDGKTNSLPPSLGRFPVFKTADLKGLPPAMIKKGGFLIPMHEREAMWIGLRTDSQFAVKIFVGGVNAISGEPARETEATAARRLRQMRSGKNIQDYVVTPKQLWVDGIASQDGKVRQFVATPLGSGYSIEAQLTGEEVLGGVQIEVTPKNLPRSHSIRLSPRFNSGKAFNITVRDTVGHEVTVSLTAEHKIFQLKHAIEDAGGWRLCDQRLLLDGERLVDDRTVGEFGIGEGDQLELFREQKGGGGPVEHGISAGDLISQTILRDDYDPDTWAPECGTIFNVQIIDAKHFKQITGMDAPDSPMTADAYKQLGGSYFEIQNEKPSGIKGDFDGVKSVNELDKSGEQTDEKAQAVAEVNHSTNNSTVLLDAEGQRVGFRPVKKMEEEVRERFRDLGL